MDLFLHLRRLVRYRAVGWLDRDRFAELGPERVLERLDAIGPEVLEDLGGFRALVRRVAAEDQWPVHLSLGEVTRRHILAVIEDAGSGYAAAARLGVDPSTLYRWRKVIERGQPIPDRPRRRLKRAKVRGRDLILRSG